MITEQPHKLKYVIIDDCVQLKKKKKFAVIFGKKVFLYENLEVLKTHFFHQNTFFPASLSYKPYKPFYFLLPYKHCYTCLYCDAFTPNCKRTQVMTYTLVILLRP